MNTNYTLFTSKMRDIFWVILSGKFFITSVVYTIIRPQKADEVDDRLVQLDLDGLNGRVTMHLD